MFSHEFVFCIEIPVSKSVDPDQTPRSAASDLVLHFCMSPQNGFSGLKGRISACYTTDSILPHVWRNVSSEIKSSWFETCWRRKSL